MAENRVVFDVIQADFWPQPVIHRAKVEVWLRGFLHSKWVGE
jgi:hypothetical protein